MIEIIGSTVGLWSGMKIKVRPPYLKKRAVDSETRARPLQLQHLFVTLQSWFSVSFFSFRHSINKPFTDLLSQTLPVPASYRLHLLSFLLLLLRLRPTRRPLLPIIPHPRPRRHALRQGGHRLV